MRVLHVSSEVAPFAQSGGLADVVAGLPAAQAELGVRAAVLVPMYRGVAARLAAAGVALAEGVPLHVAFGVHAFEATLRSAVVGRVHYGFLDLPALYDRAGGLYGPSGAGEFGDNHVRFAALGAAARAAGAQLLGGIDVLHVHDWQAGPAAIYAHLAGAQPACSIVATIHNLAYRGIFPKTAMTELGIPWSLFTPKLAEFYDQVSFLKGALALADVVTTVSPTYAQEILTPERGEAFDGFLRWDVKRLVGIVNGIDAASWDPASDPALPAAFSRQDLAGKQVCRRAVAREAGLGELAEDAPLLGVIARMTDQKGLDLVAEIAPELGTLGAKLVVLGAGEPALEDRFRYLAQAFADHVAVRIGFDTGYSRRIYAGSDLFVMPSRFEPCGLGQLYAMRYGAVPIVHGVGGLRDTVVDPGDGELAQGLGTGFRFDTPTPSALLAAIRRAVALYRDRVAFASLQRAAMARDSSWTSSAHEYVQLYRSLRA
ncbi:MAG: glycogen synthase GlgA [Kofleriaceae bacterium]